MPAPHAIEMNFDGLVGPTHNYAGLSHGNLASQAHKHEESHPRAAALQGLEKMKRLHELGVPQAVLPPHERPHVGMLRRLGFRGKDSDVLAAAQKTDPVLLAACCSASAMWAANAATVSPAPDTLDGRLHLTPANLVSTFHRSLEPAQTARALRAIFPDGGLFMHHPPLPCTQHFADEGAANHMRLCLEHGGPGVEVFVYGRRGLQPNSVPGTAPHRFPARQTLEACEVVALSHGLDPERTLLIRQDPEAIDAGAFHNDVVAVGHRHVLLYHEQAFADGSAAQRLADAFEQTCGRPLAAIRVPTAQVSLEEAVRSYVFNGQLVTLADGSICLLAPVESEESAPVRDFLEEAVGTGQPIGSVRFVDVRESMHNGGGPACLRLRVVLTDDQRRAMLQGVLFSEELYLRLRRWIERHYRETLHPDDLIDPDLLEESRAALDELTEILRLGALYDFQREGM